MPVILDHPLRLARLRKGIGQKRLSDAVGRNRSTLEAIEEGRTNNPDPGTLAGLERELGLAAGSLGPQIAAWKAARNASGPVLSPLARATLDLPADAVAQFSSFQVWRERLAASTTAFSSMLGIHRTTVAAYEGGIRVAKGLPDSLAHALFATFGLSDAYVVALGNLPPGEES